MKKKESANAHKKLIFLPHVKYLILKRQSTLDTFKILCSPKWDGDTDIPLQLYVSMIRSKLDYARLVYGSTRPSYLNMLNTFQH